MPDFQERLEILQAVARKLHLSPDVSLEEVATATETFTGADLQGLLYNAQLEAIHNSLPTLHNAVQSRLEGEDKNIKVFKLSETKDHRRSPQTHEILERIELYAQTPATISDHNNQPEEDKRQGNAPIIIMPHHIRTALDNARPSVSDRERKRYESIYSDFLGSREDFGVKEYTGLRQTLA